MLVDRKMKIDDFEYLYFDKVSCSKWLDRRSVTMLFSNVEGMETTSTVPRRKKRSESKIQVPFSEVIKTYKKGKGGVNLIDQRAATYHLDRKSTIRFYLRIFFNLMMQPVLSYIVYSMMHPNDLTMLDFKTIVSTYFIGRYTSQSRAPPNGKTGPKRKYQYQFEQGNLPPHLPEFQNIRRRCEYCYKEGIDLKAYFKCAERGVSLRLIKERNCFKLREIVLLRWDQSWSELF